MGENTPFEEILFYPTGQKKFPSDLLVKLPITGEEARLYQNVPTDKSTFRRSIQAFSALRLYCNKGICLSEYQFKVSTARNFYPFLRFLFHMR